MLNAFKIVKI